MLLWTGRPSDVKNLECLFTGVASGAMRAAVASTTAEESDAIDLGGLATLQGANVTCNAHPKMRESTKRNRVLRRRLRCHIPSDIKVSKTRSKTLQRKEQTEVTWWPLRHVDVQRNTSQAQL